MRLMGNENIHHIHLQYEPGVTLPADSEGRLFLVGSRKELLRNAGRFFECVERNPVSSYRFYPYSVALIETDTEPFLALPILNPLTHRKEYLTADFSVDAAKAVIAEAESLLKGYYREALIVQAVGSPDQWRNAVREVLGNRGQNLFTRLCSKIQSFGLSQCSDDDDDLIAPDSGICSCESTPRPASPKRKKKLTSVANENKSLSIHTEEKVSLARHRLNRLSAYERMQMFAKIPDKVTGAMEQDTEMISFINDMMDSLSPEEAKALMMHFFRKYKGAAQDAVYTLLGSESKYELLIRPRSMRTEKSYRDKAQYNMCLLDARGKELPVVFRSTPSYCIYVMHVIDRINRRENTCAMDLSTKKDEFIKVYNTLFTVDPDVNVGRIFDQLESRSDGEGKRRAGRYPEYIRDIHQTFEHLVGIENSMPFKVGPSHFLSLHPSKITIPEKLAKMKIC